MKDSVTTYTRSISVEPTSNNFDDILFHSSEIKSNIIEEINPSSNSYSENDWIMVIYDNQWYPGLIKKI